ncbi:MAG: MFS transporter [Mycobacteriales bacterium]
MQPALDDTSTLTDPSPSATSTAPAAPAPTEKRDWRDSFATLKIRNYRLFVQSQIIANTGLWMQRVAQDWLVLQLTGSVAAVGMTVALQFTPMLVFGLLGGVIADRYPKRTLLTISQSSAGVLAGMLALLTLTGAVHAWHVYLIAIMLGFVTVIDNPARQVFVNEMVGPEHLRNAISVNSSIFQLGGLIGPAISGILIHAVGEGWSFAINAVACGYVVVTLLRMRTSELRVSPTVARGKGQLREGLRYAASEPAIRWTIVLVAFVAVFGMNMPVLLAAFAKDVFHLGAGGYGLFNSLVAAGALVGALTSTRRGGIRLRLLAGAAAVFGILQATASIAPVMLIYCITLVFIGAATLVFLTGANTLVQSTAGIELRGRVMSLYVLVLLGGQAIGAVIMGRISESFGPRAAMAISGLTPAIATIGIAFILARTAQLKLEVDLHRHAPAGHLRVVPRVA